MYAIAKNRRKYLSNTAGEKQLHPSGEELPSSHTPRIKFLANCGAIHSCDDCHFLLPPFFPPSISAILHHPSLSHCWLYEIIFPSLPHVCMYITSLTPLTAELASELCHSSAQRSSLPCCLPFTHSPLWNQLFHTPEMVGLPHINTPRFDHPPSLLTQLPSTISIHFSSPPNTMPPTPPPPRPLFLYVDMCMLIKVLHSKVDN